MAHPGTPEISYMAYWRTFFDMYPIRIQLAGIYPNTYLFFIYED